MFNKADNLYLIMKDAEQELREKLYPLKNLQCQSVLKDIPRIYKRYMTLYKRWEQEELDIERTLDKSVEKRAGLA